MTTEQKKIYDVLKSEESLMAMSYWENHSFYKDYARSFGGENPKTLRLMKECEEIRIAWVDKSLKLKEFLKAIEKEKEENEIFI